ncbi:MAG: hypothetical protein AAF787_10285 [Chloroflexota bacterium]
MSNHRLHTALLLAALIVVSLALGLLVQSQGRSDSVITRRNMRYSFGVTGTYIYEYNSTLIAEATQHAARAQTQSAVMTATGTTTETPTP